MNEQELEEKMMRMIQANEKITVNRYERFDSIDPQDIM